MIVVFTIVLAYALSCALSWRRYAGPTRRGDLTELPKTGSVWAVLAFLYRPLGDLYAFDTTVGNRCYVARGPAGWAGWLSEAALAHESTHVGQAERLGWGNVWLGLPAFGVLYFLLPLPVGLAYFRYRFELEAYRAGGTPSATIIGLLSGRAYGWAWPRAWVTERLLNDAMAAAVAAKGGK